MARKAVQAASEKLASDILMLDLRERCSFADFFVICSGGTERQIKAILEEIDKVLKQEGALRLRQEGAIDSGWVLLDFGDVIVHVFSPKQRDYYQLDKVWSDGIPVVRIQ